MFLTEFRYCVIWHDVSKRTEPFETARTFAGGFIDKGLARVRKIDLNHFSMSHKPFISGLD